MIWNGQFAHETNAQEQIWTSLFCSCRWREKICQIYRWQMSLLKTCVPVFIYQEKKIKLPNRKFARVDWSPKKSCQRFRKNLISVPFNCVIFWSVHAAAPSSLAVSDQLRLSIGQAKPVFLHPLSAAFRTIGTAAEPSAFIKYVRPRKPGVNFFIFQSSTLLDWTCQTCLVTLFNEYWRMFHMFGHLI